MLGRFVLVLAGLALLMPTPEALAGCAGVCGDQDPYEGCYCDDSCFDFGDCCADVCSACPTLTGCGGGGGQCGNGYCEPTEDQSTCPSDCSGGCGAVTYEGCCQGQTLKYCENGVLKSIDCNQAPSCGWQPDGNYYDCQTGGTPDPSGMYPMACSGGSNPICGNGACEMGENASTCPADCGGSNPICGNGACEAGETQQTCPADCAGGPICGNGACEPGETQQTCPNDCGAGCGTKECGFDGQGNPCGTCPEGFYCDWEGHCQSDTPCEPECEGKQCGDDGCNGSCGTCPANLVCSGDYLCVSPYPGQDITQPGEEDVICTPDCSGRVCGDDGCGGTCGVCPEGFGCTEQGLCEQGYIPPEPDVSEDTEVAPSPDNPYGCPAGQSLMYGKCVFVGEEKPADEGCTAGPTGSLPAALLLLILTALLAAARRRA